MTAPSNKVWTSKGDATMSAYVITEIEITDASLYGQFLERVTSTVEAHGGKFIVRGGETEIILGDWTPKRIAMLEFDTHQQVHAWLDSPEYMALDDIRSRSSNINMVVVEGL
jgi:uncharacterized protein (DUF1330 family)